MYQGVTFLMNFNIFSKRPESSSSEPSQQEPISGSSPTAITYILWEAYLWVLFFIQMFSWAIMLAGTPTFIEYLDPAVKLPGWIGLWAFFRGNQLFLQKERRYYLLSLLAWEVVYALLSLTGFGGVPFIPKVSPQDGGAVQLTAEQFQPTIGVLIQYAIVSLPFYWALWRFSQQKDAPLGKDSPP
jgi:hypothetical protein